MAAPLARVIKKIQQWVKDEEVQLGKSYIRVSEDPAGPGSDQRKDSSWVAVGKDFAKFAPPLRRDRQGNLYLPRTPAALKLKWSKINKDCLL